jgi:hypothetical protein
MINPATDKSKLIDIPFTAPRGILALNVAGHQIA